MPNWKPAPRPLRFEMNTVNERVRLRNCEPTATRLFAAALLSACSDFRPSQRHGLDTAFIRRLSR